MTQFFKAPTTLELMRDTGRSGDKDLAQEPSVSALGGIFVQFSALFAMPSPLRYAQQLLVAFAIGWTLVVLLEVAEARQMISDFTESTIRLAGWTLLMVYLLASATRPPSTLSWPLVVFCLCSTLGWAVGVTEDIEALDTNAWLGHDGAWTQLVKKLLFGGWAFSLVVQFHRLYGELETINQRLLKRVNDADVSEARYRELLGSHIESNNEVRKLRAEVAHSARVSMLGEMAGGLAHELNQPLAAISNLAYSAKVKLDAIEHVAVSEVATLMETVVEQSQRAGAIINRLKRLVEKSGPSRSTVDINEMIREVVVLIESEIRIAGIELTLDLDAQLPTLLVDRIQIQQVLLNLLRNAFDAVLETNRSGGHITVTSKKPDDDFVEVAIADNGIGIDPRPIDSIFDAFQSTNQSGMGLAICKSIMDQHGGKIWADQNLSEGAVFHIALKTSPE